MRPISTLTLVFFTALAQASDPLATAIFQGDRELLETHAETLAKRESPGDQTYAAYAFWRLSTLSEDPSAALERCVTSTSFVDNSKSAPGLAHAVRGSCFGMMAGQDPMAGMTYGPKSAGHFDEAVLIAPDDPNVLLLVAMSDYYTPLVWGGDIDRAIRRLRQIIDTLAETPQLGDPWVLPEAYAYLVQSYLKIEECESARAALAKGLAVTPRHPIINDQLEQKVARCSL